MAKTITPNQQIGELGEAAVRKRFLSMGFQFDQRSRLEAGIDGIAEVMIDGEPTARMIAVQVKSTKTGRYTAETTEGFTYLLEAKDLQYWKTSNLPVILVVYRESDDSLYWSPITFGPGVDQRRLVFDKARDLLDRKSLDRLAALTVPKNGFGYYVPPLGDGETALLNLIPLVLPEEMYVASTSYESKAAMAVLRSQEGGARFDWAIKGRTFWSFHDPRESVTRAIVDVDQIDAIETRMLAFHEDLDEQNNFAFLLRQIFQHQFQKDLAWDKFNKIFYFRALEENRSRTFHYKSSKQNTSADVVTLGMQSKDPSKVSFVRHHAFAPRFECLMDQWFLTISPTYHFTTNGFLRHSFPDALLSGKKRLDNNASLRGQLIMWHRLLSQADTEGGGLFAPLTPASAGPLRFLPPPEIELPTTVPEDAWGKPKVKMIDAGNASGLLFDEI